MAGIQDLLNRSSAEVNNLSMSELRKNIQQLSDAANKRLKRLSGSEIGRSSPALHQAQRKSYNTPTGGKFGVKDIDRNYKDALKQLRERYNEVAGFLKKTSSSLKKIKTSMKAADKRIGIKLSSFGITAAYWRAYRMLEEQYMLSGNGQYDSATIQKDLRKLMLGRTSILTDINRSNMEPAGTLDKHVKERDESARLLAKQGIIRLPDGTDYEVGRVRTAEDIAELGRIMIDSFGQVGRPNKFLPIIDTDVT